MLALYKFIADPDVIQFLLKGIVKFTPISELNDPSELVPRMNIDEVKASLSRLRKYGYSEQDITRLRQQGNLLQRLAPQLQAIKVPRTQEAANAVVRSSFYDSIDILEQRLSETAQEMSSKVGLFCLSQRYDALPMWAHYANNAKGLAVEFRDLETVFTGDDTGVLSEPVPVRYEQEKQGVTFDPKSHESLFFTKFQDWSYEQEVRIVLPLAECQQHISSTSTLHFQEIPHACIARLIIGWNMKPDKAALLLSCVRAINPDVEIVQARISRGQVKLESSLDAT